MYFLPNTSSLCVCTYVSMCVCCALNKKPPPLKLDSGLGQHLSQWYTIHYVVSLDIFFFGQRDPLLSFVLGKKETAVDLTGEAEKRKHAIVANQSILLLLLCSHYYMIIAVLLAELYITLFILWTQHMDTNTYTRTYKTT